MYMNKQTSYSNMRADEVSMPMPSPEIPHLNERLAGSIQSLDKLLGDLSARLAGVCSPELEGSVGGGEPPCLSGLGSQIVDNTRCIESMCAAVGNLLHRLQL